MFFCVTLFLFLLCLLSHVVLFFLGPVVYDEYSYIVNFVFAVVGFTFGIIDLIKFKMKKDFSMFEKMKTMSLVEMSVFLNSILSRDSLLDDMWCESCHKSHGCCPVGDGECIHTDKDVILWFLEQPYDSLQSLLEQCSEYHQRRDSE